MKLDVTGFGALNMDKLFYVDHLAKKDEESFVMEYTEAPGGSAANTIVGLARLGLNTGYIGKLSNDGIGKLLLQDLINENVDTKGIIMSKEGLSGIVFCFVDKNGERAMYVMAGVNDALTLEEIDIDYCRNTKFLHLTSFIGKKPFETQKTLIKNLTNSDVSLDTGMFYSMKGLQALKPLIKRCFVLFLNGSELKVLTGENYIKGSKSLIEEGAQIVAVKLGNKGCYVTDGREKHLVEPYKVKVVDTTGAGDAFCAGFLYSLLKNKDLYVCAKLGNFLASQKISKRGAREGLPSLSDLPTYL